MEESFKNELLKIAIELYKTGPNQSNIWNRSGGDISLLFINQVGRNAWYEAIELLTNGGGGRDITMVRLIEEMAKDFPNNQSLTQLWEQFLLNQNQSKILSISDSNDPIYKAEDQFWFVADFVSTSQILPMELQTIVSEIEIAIFTATEVELKYALSHFVPLDSKKEVLKGSWEGETYYIGKFGAFNTVLTKCEMGLTGSNSSILATEETLRIWKPKAAFMVGIAFAKNPEKQHIGQVLIAKSIIPYDNQRVGETIIYRGTPLTSDITLLNRFENAYDWKFTLPDGTQCKKESGSILSAEKLVDNLKFRDKLFKEFSTAIGGEMEGAGFYAAAHRKRIPCLLLKSICDWGDGQKHKKHQPLAAATSSSLLFHVLSQRSILNLNH